MSSERHYEMLWDCQYCGTNKLLGKTHRHCPNCGAAQNPDSRYYPSDDEKVAVEDHVYVGADKICPACSGLNTAAAEFCGNCGSPLTDAARAKTLEEQSNGAGEAFQTTGSRDVTKEKFDAEMQRIGVQPKPGEKSGGIGIRGIAIIGVIILVIGGIIFALTATREATVVVAGHSWEREIRIEQYNNFTVQSWQDAPPIGDEIFMVPGTCVDRQRSTRQVPDGEECRTVRTDRGDGTFSERQECRTVYRSEPVYDRWCTWTGKKWDYLRSVTTNGQNVSESPFWGEVSLNCANQRSVGCEREASREEEYMVLFNGDGNEYRCPFPQNEWENIRLESIWTVQVRRVDASAANCDSLSPSAR